MRLLLLLLFISTSLKAQKIFTILNETNTPISGVSVFTVDNKPTLLAISDEKGIVNLALKAQANYLIHCMGYADTSINSDKLDKLSFIRLREISHPLDEISANAQLSDFVIKKPVLDKVHSIISDLPQNSNIQRVISITIDSGGYLKRLKLFCKVQVKDVAPDYRFLLFSEKNGKPDTLILPLNLKGIRSKREIVFDLMKTNYFLEKGNYFIGYETYNGKAVTKSQIHLHKDKKYITLPVVIYASEENKISFIRQNLSKWTVPKIGVRVDGKLEWEDDLKINFAYELYLMH